MAELIGRPNGAGKRFAVIASRFNEEITKKLADAAMETLVQHGAAFDDIDLIWVPGAWEIPIAARRAMMSDRYDAIVAVGAVIRGDTPHFDYVAGECARGLNDASLEFEIPVGFGVLTCDNDEQAEARSGGGSGAHGNKGRDAALAAMEMADLMQMLEPLDEDSQ